MPIQEKDTVRTITLKNKEVILLGTAHVSRDSIREVEEVIEEGQPDHVCVEIDQGRYKTLTEGQNWSNLNISQVIRKKQGFLLLANLALSSYQRRLGTQVGTTQGMEMLTGVELAQQKGLPCTFADREVQITLRRAWSCSSFWQKMKLLAALLGSALTREKMSEEDLEELKNKNALESMMSELADYLPTAKEVFIDERDQYLATKIHRAAGKRIVAVVGAGHMTGIVNWLEKLDSPEGESDLTAITRVPPPSRWTKVLPWLIPAAVIGLLTYGFINSGFQQGLSMLKAWILANGVLASIGAVAALGHPVTIAVTFLAAPFTSMNPTIGVGIVSGMLEAVLRKPRVRDFEELHDDIASLKGWYRNRLTRILLVFFFTTLGSALGTFIALPYLLTLFS